MHLAIEQLSASGDGKSPRVSACPSSTDANCCMGTIWLTVCDSTSFTVPAKLLVIDTERCCDGTGYEEGATSTFDDFPKPCDISETTQALLMYCVSIGIHIFNIC